MFLGQNIKQKRTESPEIVGFNIYMLGFLKQFLAKPRGPALFKMFRLRLRSLSLDFWALEVRAWLRIRNE